jgi:hypothetical protein
LRSNSAGWTLDKGNATKTKARENTNKYLLPLIANLLSRGYY